MLQPTHVTPENTEHPTHRVKPVFVSSSTIDCIGYVAGKLLVRFKTGTAYSYDACPYTYFAALQSVESAGKFFSKNIRSKFHYTKLQADPFTGEILT